MLQVESDWSMTGSAAEIEEQLSGDAEGEKFKFTGPGFYLTETDTLLIMPMAGNPKDPKYPKSIWNKPSLQPEDRYRVYVYNCPFSQTIFSQCAVAPTRQDDRGL